LAVVAAGLTAAVFAPTLGNGWVNWDDPVLFLENPHFRGFSGAHLRWMFTTTLMGHYVPVTWLTHALDHALWGMDPRGYHATSVALHALNAALVFLTARRLLPGGGRLAAVVAALAFALHPLRVESVAWVTERRDVVSGFFILLAMLVYLRAAEQPPKARVRWLAVSLLAFAASLLSKAITMTFPAVLVLVDVYVLRRRGRLVWFEKIPFVCVGALGAVVALLAIRTTPLNSWEMYGPLDRLALMSFGFAFYLVRTLVPIGLSPIYQAPSTVSLVVPPFLLSGLAVVGLSAAAVAARRRAPWFTAAWGAYLVMVLPVSGVVRGGLSLAHDRYSYVACLPWALLLGVGVGKLAAAARRVAPPVRVAVAGAVLAVLGGWSYLTVLQIGVWRNATTLWSMAVGMDPACSACRLNLLRVLIWEGQLDAAEHHMRVALARDPTDSKLHNNLAMVLYAQQRYPEASGSLNAALRLQPEFPEALNNLGMVYEREGKLPEARAQFQAALAVRPDFVEARRNLARVGASAEPP
jgi:protein O-mannosyl-transferase